MNTKKKLTVMPEVLPSPTVVTSGSVRNRTLARLKVLAAFSAGALAASCGGKSEGNGGGSGDRSLADGGTDGGGIDPYGVVDPLPQPSCFKQRPTGAAHFTTNDELDPDAGADDAGVDAGFSDAGLPQRLVTVDLNIPDASVAVGDVSAQGNAEIVSSSFSGNTGRVIVRLLDTNSPAQVRVSASCSAGPDAISIYLKLNGDSINVSVN